MPHTHHTHHTHTTHTPHTHHTVFHTHTTFTTHTPHTPHTPHTHTHNQVESKDAEETLKSKLTDHLEKIESLTQVMAPSQFAHAHTLTLFPGPAHSSLAVWNSV